MRHIHKPLKQAGFLAAAFLTATLLLAPSAMAAAPGFLGTWNTSANTLPDELYMASAVTYNGYVYIMDGVDNTGDLNANVYYAKLNSDGSVGTWNTSANTIPYPLYGASTVVYNGYVYLFGGDFSGANFDKVFYAKLNSDGTVGAWNTSTNVLPQAAGWSTAVTHNGYVYVMGGYGNPTGPPFTPIALDTVYYAKLNTDGTVGAWNTSVNALPQGVVNTTSVIQNGYAYVMGGGDENFTAQSAVYYAKLNTDGTVGAWNTSVNALPQALNGATSFTANGSVYVTGGGSADVVYAKLNGDGTVGVWAATANALPQGLVNPSAVTANGFVYVLGGADSNNVALSTVYYSSLESDPAPGASPNGSPAAATLTAPDTGYGASPSFDPIVLTIAAGSIVSVGFGLSLLYHYKRRERPNETI